MPLHDDAKSDQDDMMQMQNDLAGSSDGTGQASEKWGNSVFGVLIVIGAIILAAMFFVLYVRAIAAEKRADMLSAEVATLRDELAKRI